MTCLELDMATYIALIMAGTAMCRVTIPPFAPQV